MIAWSEEQRALRSAFAKWGEALSDDHLGWDERAEFPSSKWCAVRDSGILRLPFPEVYGGLERDLCTTMYVLEELGYRCEDSGLSFALTTHLVGVGIPLARFGTAEQRAELLPGVVEGTCICGHAITEPDSGSDAFAMRTTAVRDGDHYVINGRKTFISNGPIGDLFVVYVMTDKSQGALGGSTAFLVSKDTPGFTRGPPIAKMGLKSAPLGELIFEDCRVPAHRVLGTEGLGFSILDFVMKWEILCSFIVSVGEMQRRLEKCVEYARTRKQFGHALGSFQAISHKLVDMRVGVELARAWLYRTAERVQRNESASVDVAIAKLIASEQNISSALNAVQIFGGYGYMRESGIEKDVRNALAGTIYSGTSEIQRNRIARIMGL